jgi:hypothetical protein
MRAPNMNATKQWQTILLVLACTACGKKAEETKGDSTTKAVETKKDAPKGASGIDDPANDKAVVALAKEAIKCKWDGAWGLKSDCPALDAFNKADAVKDGKVDATLINFLADGAKEVRWLAANALYNSGKEFSKNAEMSKKVLAAAKIEKDASRRMGDIVGKIDVEKTKLADDVKKLLAESTNSPLREGIVGGILWNNRKEGGFYDVLAALARTDKDKAVRKAAAGAFWVSGSDRKEDTCKLWLELSADADDDLAGHSAYHCGFWSSGGGCQTEWDALLDVVEKKAKEGAVKSAMMAASLKYLIKQSKASDAQKKRVLAIAKTLVENDKNPGMSRSDGLRTIGENDPDAKAYAAKFENDKEFFVKNTAKDIKEGKISVKK